MKRKKYDFSYDFETEYDSKVFNNYEGYNQSDDDDWLDSYDDNIDELYARCECCSEAYIVSSDDFGYMCHECTMSVIELENDLEDDVIITDANKMNKDEFYIENGIMDKHVLVPVHFDFVLDFNKK